MKRDYRFIWTGTEGKFCKFFPEDNYGTLTKQNQQDSGHHPCLTSRQQFYWQDALTCCAKQRRRLIDPKKTEAEIEEWTNQTWMQEQMVRDKVHYCSTLCRLSSMWSCPESKNKKHQRLIDNYYPNTNNALTKGFVSVEEHIARIAI